MLEHVCWSSRKLCTSSLLTPRVVEASPSRYVTRKSSPINIVLFSIVCVSFFQLMGMQVLPSYITVPRQQIIQEREGCAQMRGK